MEGRDRQCHRRHRRNNNSNIDINENVTEIEGDNAPAIVTSVTLSPAAATVNGTAEVAIILGPEMSVGENGNITGTFDSQAISNVTCKFDDNSVASYSYSNGKITLTGTAVGKTAMTVSLNFHQIKFSSGEYGEGQPREFTVPVTVTAVAPSGSGTSGSTGGGGGGCSAGFGALALLAAVPLFFRRKK